MTKQITTKILLALIILLQYAEGWFNSGGMPKKPNKAPHSTQPKKPITPPPPPKSQLLEMPEFPESVSDTLDDLNPISPGVWNSMTSAALSFASMLAPKSIKESNNRAASIQINRLPPTSFRVDLTDVPLVGKALSGTYAKVKDEGKVKNPSVVIASPCDKYGAIQDAAEKGTLEFNLGGLLSSNVDIQLEPNRPGVAPVSIQSPLIPRWPFAQRKSNWNRVSNCGNGDTYYFNSQTGETQIEEPLDI